MPGGRPRMDKKAKARIRLTEILPEDEIKDNHGCQHENTECDRLAVPRLVFPRGFRSQRMHQAEQFVIWFCSRRGKRGQNCDCETTAPGHNGHPKTLAHFAAKQKVPRK